MLRKSLFISTLFAFVLSLTALPGSAAISQEFDKIYSLQSGGTFNGTVSVVGVDSIDDLHTVNGNIEVYDGGGNVHAHTTNGNIHLELAHFVGATGASAETTNGSLLVALPADAQADIETRCLNGNFLSEMPLTMQSTLKPREMHGKLGGGGAPIKLRTINGGIRIVTLRATV